MNYDFIIPYWTMLSNMNFIGMWIANLFYNSISFGFFKKKIGHQF